MPRGSSAKISGHADGRSAGQWPPHEKIIYGYGTNEDADGKEKRNRIGPKRGRATRCLCDKGIEQTHENATGDADLNSARTNCLGFVLAPAIGNSICNDREENQSYSSEQEQHVSLRGERVIQKHANHKRQPNSYRKGNGQPSDIDGGHQQQIRNIKDGASGECVSNM